MYRKKKHIIYWKKLKILKKNLLIVEMRHLEKELLRGLHALKKSKIKIKIKEGCKWVF